MNYVKITNTRQVKVSGVAVDSKSLQDHSPKTRGGWRRRKNFVMFDKNIIDLLLLYLYDICDDCECVTVHSIFKIHFIFLLERIKKVVSDQSWKTACLPFDTFFCDFVRFPSNIFCCKISIYLFYQHII